MTTGCWEPGETVQAWSALVQAHTSNDMMVMVRVSTCMCVLQHQLKATMDSLTSKVPQFLLQQGKPVLLLHLVLNPSPPLPADVLEYYLSCSDLNTPGEFLTRYNTPTHILLDRGRHSIIIITP